MVHCSPSNAFRWSKCLLSAHSDRLPTTGRGRSESAVEGLAAHWVADLILHGDATCAEDLLGRTSPQGHIITEEIAGHVDEYIERLRTLGPTVKGKRRIKINEHIGGEVDADVLDSGPILNVVELKYGFKIHEPAYHPQLMLYARGLLQDHHQSVALYIFQPRPPHRFGPWRKWTTSREVIIGHTDWLMERSMEAQQSNPKATPGDYCYECPGAQPCHALGLNIFSFMEIIEAKGWEVNPSKVELGKQLSLLQKCRTLLDARLNGVTTIVEHHLNRGEHVPGWIFRDKIGQRKFKLTADEIEFVTGVKATVEKLATPAELQRRGVSREVIDQLTHKPTVGRELVEATPDEFERLFKSYEQAKHK